MTDLVARAPVAGDMVAHRPDLSPARVRRRYAAERRFRMYGLAAILLALSMLLVLLGTVVFRGYTAFWQSVVTLEVHVDPAKIDPQGTRDAQVLRMANYEAL